MRTINIKGQTYKIKYLSRKQMNEKTENAAGLCNIQEKVIYVCTDQPKSEIIKTLYHEISHALSEEVGLRQIITYSAEQILCEAFSSFIYKHFIEKKHGRKNNKTKTEKT